jgi:hypothetical protein
VADKLPTLYNPSVTRHEKLKKIWETVLATDKRNDLLVCCLILTINVGGKAFA